MEKRRRIWSILLLAVYLAAMSCVVSHRHEAPHFSELESAESYSPGIADCVLCHFLWLPYVFALIAVFLPPVFAIRTICIPERNYFVASFLGCLKSRAPPVLE